ncbi:MAG TPA: cell division protein ZipA [Rhodanobacteraceae bacterium]
MDTDVISPTALRVIIAIIGVAILLVIYFFGRPRQPGQGRRLFPRRDEGRVEPVLGDADASTTLAPQQGELDVDLQRELDRLGTVVADPDAAPRTAASANPAPAPAPTVGARAPAFPVDRIVTLFVVAPDGATFGGSDIAVAAEKAGLRFGAMHIFHRLVNGHPEAGPIFSMANMLKPGYFDMAHIGDLATPGITFFATLPGPVAALDAWDAMLPAVQRIAELLGGAVLDEDRNTLGRQRIAGIREELRTWDRQHLGELIHSPAPQR